MKPVKREMVSLAELRQGDTCVITVEPDGCLVVNVVDVRPAENLLLYLPAFFRTVGVPEFVPAGDKVCTSTFPPGTRFQRIVLEAGVDY